MGCCGKNRAALTESIAQGIPPLPRAPLNVQPTRVRAQTFAPRSAEVAVRYMERLGVVVHGSVTGRRYAFSATNPVQSVDARDAGAFWHSRYFRRA
jgi:hypothetical protein